MRNISKIKKIVVTILLVLCLLIIPFGSADILLETFPNTQNILSTTLPAVTFNDSTSNIIYSGSSGDWYIGDAYLISDTCANEYITIQKYWTDGFSTTNQLRVNDSDCELWENIFWRNYDSFTVTNNSWFSFTGNVTSLDAGALFGYLILVNESGGGYMVSIQDQISDVGYLNSYTSTCQLQLGAIQSIPPLTRGGFLGAVVGCDNLYGQVFKRVIFMWQDSYATPRPVFIDEFYIDDVSFIGFGKNKLPPFNISLSIIGKNCIDANNTEGTVDVAFNWTAVDPEGDPIYYANNEVIGNTFTKTIQFNDAFCFIGICDNKANYDFLSSLVYFNDTCFFNPAFVENLDDRKQGFNLAQKNYVWKISTKTECDRLDRSIYYDIGGTSDFFYIKFYETGFEFTNVNASVNITLYNQFFEPVVLLKLNYTVSDNTINVFSVNTTESKNIFNLTDLNNDFTIENIIDENSTTQYNIFRGVNKSSIPFFDTNILDKSIKYFSISNDNLDSTDFRIGKIKIIYNLVVPEFSTTIPVNISLDRIGLHTLNFYTTDSEHLGDTYNSLVLYYTVLPCSLKLSEDEEVKLFADAYRTGIKQGCEVFGNGLNFDMCTTLQWFTIVISIILSIPIIMIIGFIIPELVFGGGLISLGLYMYLFNKFFLEYTIGQKVGIVIIFTLGLVVSVMAIIGGTKGGSGE